MSATWWVERLARRRIALGCVGVSPEPSAIEPRHISCAGRPGGRGLLWLMDGALGRAAAPRWRRTTDEDGCAAGGTAPYTELVKCGRASRSSSSLAPSARTASSGQPRSVHHSAAPAASPLDLRAQQAMQPPRQYGSRPRCQRRAPPTNSAPPISAHGAGATRAPAQARACRAV